MPPVLLVAFGGALGAALRFSVAEVIARRSGAEGLPLGTFIINVTGCFLIALFLGYASGRSGLAPGWRYLFPIGFVGGYTTFSTYAWEIQRLLERRSFGSAAAYFIGSNAAGLAAVYAGLWLGRRL